MFEIWQVTYQIVQGYKIKWNLMEMKVFAQIVIYFSKFFHDLRYATVNVTVNLRDYETLKGMTGYCFRLFGRVWEFSM